MPARDLEREVEALLDRSVFTIRSGADHVLTGHIEQRAEGWVARLQLQTRAGAVSGTREVVATGSCARLNRPLVIVIATLLDTSVSDGSGAARLGVGLMLQADLGTLPRPSAGAGLLVDVQPGSAWPALRLRLGGLLPQRETGGEVSASFLAVRAGLSVCPSVLSQGALALVLCAGVDAGGMGAQAASLTPARRPVRMLASLPVEVEVAWRLWARLLVLVGVGASLELLRPAFYFEDAVQHTQVVHRVPVWSAAARFAFIVDVL